jgi:hypothetical protein
MKKLLLILTLFISLGAAAQFKTVQVPQTDYPATGDMLQYVTNKWRVRTTAQMKLALGINGTVDSQTVWTALGNRVLYTDTSTMLGAYRTALLARQATLVSGTNIKTINGTSLLGSGNITIEGGEGGSTDTTSLSARIDERVKYTDTSTMLSAYRTALNARLKISDTAAMQAAYQTALNARVKYTDTSTMLGDYRSGLLARVRHTDTSTILSAYQTAINARLKTSDTAAMLDAYENGLIDRVKWTDTSTLFSAYRTAINARMKYSDTASMLSAYQAALNARASTSDLSGKANLAGGNTFTGEQTIDSLDVTTIHIGGPTGVNRLLIDADGDGYGAWEVYNIPIPDGDYGHIEVNGSSWSLTSLAKTLLHTETAETKNKTINGDSNTISNLTAAMFKVGEIEDLDQDLQDIGAISASSGDFLIKGASAWEKKTTAETKTILGIVTPLSTITDGSTAPVESNAIFDALALKANLASPALTGTPTAPTAAAATNTTQIATTAHVFAERTNTATLTNKTLTSPTITTPTVDGVTLSSTWEDYTVQGLQVLGSEMKAQPISAQYTNSGTSITLTDGRINFVAVFVPHAMTITGVGFQIGSTSGVYTADNTNSVALYSFDGTTLTKVAESANNGSLFTATALDYVKEPFASPVAVSRGVYYAAILWNASATTTAPTIMGVSTSGVRSFTLDLPSSRKLWGFLANATMPSTQAISSMSTHNNIYWCFLY